MGKVLYFFIWKHLHGLVITFIGFRPNSVIGPELQSGVKCSEKNSCNYLELLLAKAAKNMHSFRFIATKSRNHLNLSPTKVAKMYSLFFNHLEKLSRLIASKGWEKLQWSQFTASKSRKKVQSFRFISSKARKNCNEFFQST